MTEQEFNKRLLGIDRELAQRRIPTIVRSVPAWFHFTGARVLHSAPTDPNLGPYDGPNLIGSIGAWYKRFYPQQSVIGPWGKRLLIIQGEVFRLSVPTIFNPSTRIEARDHIEEMSDDLWAALQEGERNAIQSKFDVFFRQTSDIQLCIAICAIGSRRTVAGDLLLRGSTDLRRCCDGFDACFPTAILFDAQQATEKFLKAVLAHNEPNLIDADLRKIYGHRLPKLLAACAVIDDHFRQIEPYIDALDFSADVRYRDMALPVGDAVYRIDLSHSICHLAARRLINTERPGGPHRVAMGGAKR